MMRKGFSMVMAIFFIVTFATLGVLSLSLSSTSVKQTTDFYLKEQAELLGRSAIEFALLAISGHTFNAAGGCLNSINFVYENTFTVNIAIAYAGNGLPVGCAQIGGNIQTVESNLTAMIDVFVQSADAVSTEPIRYHYRTIQRPF